MADEIPSGARERVVSYEVELRLARFSGPGGFTQIVMTEQQARAIALALGVRFEIARVDG